VSESSTQNQPSTPNRGTLLIVDDDSSILKALKRVFHGQQYRLVLADDAVKAIDFMRNNAVHVVISDMQMPGMSGSEFLSIIATEFANTYRIVLSGHADNESVLSAVNNGKIHRYIQKPWDNESLLAAIQEGFAHYQSAGPNSDEFEKLVLQNKKLRALNTALEQKVDYRTTQVKGAINKVERGVTALKKSLYNSVTVSPYLNSAFSKKVSQLSEKLAQSANLDVQQISHIRYSALICEIGMLGVPVPIIKKSFFMMSGNEQAEFYKQCDYARKIFAPIPQLQSIADIVCNQFEHVNGKGYPGKLSDKSLPIGAKILSVARDYYAYMDGRIDEDKYNASVTLQLMQKFAGLRYDKALIAALVELTKDEQQDSNDIGISSSDLIEGMVLKEPLFNKNDILVLPEGHTFDEASIARLMSLEKRFNMHFSILVE
jgi:response regulator RpfG family c-di-GMP phosphodiesterase